MLRVPFAELAATLTRHLQAHGYSLERARRAATLIAETDRDGVHTHGLARVPRLLAMLRSGAVDPHAEPTPVAAFGALERWDGHRGPGNLNAEAAMGRAIEVARTHGLGCVALAQTNHWMRGGSYGWQAAEAGLIGMCWTNTLPNLPAWGGTTPTLGNNPLVMAVPQANGAHVVLDMAMSQFSFGTLDRYAQQGQALPFAGGFDAAGNLTTNPEAIQASGRALPIGMWKGSGLALMLDMVAALLSGGRSTHQIPADPLRESGLSQVFLAIDPARLGSPEQMEQITTAILANLHDAPPSDTAHPLRYPGEQTLRLRQENLRLGVPVDPEIWGSLQGS